MPEKQKFTHADARRAQTRERLLQAAEAAIAAQGLAGLKARDLAAAAGCALGAIYNVFEDMDELIMRVGVRTLLRLEEQLAQRSPASDGAEELATLAALYLAFARDHEPLWRALFGHRLPPGRALPDWYEDARDRLFETLDPPLARLAPNLAAPERAALARTLFSAVHGVVALGLDGKLASRPLQGLDAQLDAFVRLVAAGLTRRD